MVTAWLFSGARRGRWRRRLGIGWGGLPWRHGRFRRLRLGRCFRFPLRSGRGGWRSSLWGPTRRRSSGSNCDGSSGICFGCCRFFLLLLGFEVPLLRNGESWAHGQGPVGVEHQLLRADHVSHGSLVEVLDGRRHDCLAHGQGRHGQKERRAYALRRWRSHRRQGRASRRNRIAGVCLLWGGRGRSKWNLGVLGFRRLCGLVWPLLRRWGGCGGM